MQSFRSYKLATLRLTSLLIDDRIHTNQNAIDKIKSGLKYKARSVVFFWSLFISAFFALLVLFTTSDLQCSLYTFFAFVSISLAVTFIPAIINKLIASHRYRQAFAKIAEYEQDSHAAQTGAGRYQQHLEINNGPGFICLYRDVILADNFESEIPIKNRQDMLEASENGFGKNIDLYSYANLLNTLKQQGITDSSSIADTIAGQSDDKACLAYTDLICDHFEDTSLSQLHISALIGLHCHSNFHLESFDTDINESWDLSNKIFNDSLSRQTENLSRHINAYQSLKNSQLLDVAV
ncbi:MAG: hypothetical protein HRU20_02490 [Pseudomonadales bacterium]|nr:hypothetical protein [Pseudomonadales bacterium]